MALREHSRSAATGRGGRHGRARPFGGRLRLPTIRFSGAAMAMSTVVGISLATTWLLSEQQQVGRRPGVSVGGPPVPSPDASEPAPAPSTTAGQGPGPTPDTDADGQQPTSATTPSTRPSATPTRSSARPATAAGSTAPATPVAAVRPSVSPTAATTSPSPSASPSAPPSLRPTASPAPPHTLTGEARIDSLGRTGTRHTVQLELAEPMTALLVEFRLQRPTALPGTTPGTDLPGALTTISLDRDTLIYRFATPPGLTLAAGTYTFTVTGALPAPTAAAPESWTASAFALPTTRALTARGTF
ncbi:hypothetical protein AB0K51_24420 [Kitasatospora sp. NPDC049285]|uniref:hypothetical protein n=1 Tax=Kitasatospora sp. NPDC049285 TaxID=3157096 RepID=UPI003415389F